MRIDVLTLFPEMFRGPMEASIIQRARQKGLLELRAHNLRDYAHDNYKTVDDRPFGGGPGMVLKCEPIFEALQALKGAGTRVVLMTPAGRPFHQSVARELSSFGSLLLICGSYEGVDERVREQWVDEELSIGDYVL
ncbi:MAG: tRNA (guanosine(37)-N1)-methyltransferase TrmD, partial [Verrucomicrobiota bacterium]